VDHVGVAFSAGHSIDVTRGMVVAFAAMTGADHWMHVYAGRATTSQQP
jgi:hypothetical protein